MQTGHHTIDPHTQNVLHEEWRRMPQSARPGASSASSGKSPAETPQPHELSPVIAVLPQLIRLACECHDQSVNKLRPTIKRMILEHLFMEVGGDSIVDAHQMMHVRLYVDLTVRVLVRLRRQGLPEDEWSDTPVTPQMFG